MGDMITPFMIASTSLLIFFAVMILYGLRQKDKQRRKNPKRKKDHNDLA